MLVTDGRKTEANTDPLSTSQCVFPKQKLTRAHAQQRHKLECVLPWYIMEWHWHFPPAISHTCIDKTMQTKATYPWGRAAIALSLLVKTQLECRFWSSSVSHDPLLWAILSSQNERGVGRASLCLCAFLSQANSSKCWGLFIKVTMINNDWCCNYRPIAALFDEEF